MKYLTLILIFVCSVAWGQPINEKYSYKAFPYHRLSFKDRSASEFNNTTIVGSCFYQDWFEGNTWQGEKDIFPNGMTGVTFERCNLDNIYIPPGNTVVGGTKKKIKPQNDLSDWILDDNLKPKEPMDKVRRLEAGISVDPKDIPLTKQDKNVFEKVDISN